MITYIQLIPEGVESEPLFKTEEEYEKFYEEYREKVVPILEENKRKMALSWHDAQHHIIY